MAIDNWVSIMPQDIKKGMKFRRTDKPNDIYIADDDARTESGRVMIATGGRRGWTHPETKFEAWVLKEGDSLPWTHWGLGRR